MKTTCANNNSARYMSSRIDAARTIPYDSQAQALSRRVASTSSTVSHTAASIVNAYGRASMPAHVARGNKPQTIPELTATVRDENCLPNPTTPAAAPPTARPLGARDQNSVGGKI